MKIDYVFSFANHFYKELYRQHFNCTLINPRNVYELQSVDVTKNIIFLFGDPYTLNYINRTNLTGNNVMFLRRHEFYENNVELLQKNRHKIQHFFTLNTFFQKKLKDLYGIESEIERNYLDEQLWTYKKRENGREIAWVGEFQQRKSPDYLCELLYGLPDHNFHCAVSPGPAQQLYMDFLNTYNHKNLFLYQLINTQNKMNAWLEDKNYLVTTSISEGLPNNVLEALAKGIKPVVRHYPGNIFDKFTYRNISELKLCLSGEYDSAEYRQIVSDNYGLKQFLEFRDKIHSL
jgi:hypothetical protein